MIRYFCDKCNKEVESDSELKTIKLFIGHYYNCGLNNNYADTKLSICEECEKELGLYKFVQDNKYTKEPTPKDKFFEIIREMVADCIADIGEYR